MKPGSCAEAAAAIKLLRSFGLDFPVGDNTEYTAYKASKTKEKNAERVGSPTRREKTPEGPQKARKEDGEGKVRCGGQI